MAAKNQPIDGGEVVRCEHEGCRSQAFVNLPGTMPNRWFGCWVAERYSSIRCCSLDCLRAAKQQTQAD